MSGDLPFCMRCGTRHTDVCGGEARQSQQPTHTRFDRRQQTDVDSDEEAALRRYLVDEEFLERRQGFYWRAGGTFELD